MSITLPPLPEPHICRWPDCACDTPVCGDADASKKRHDASADCWCMPTLDYTDPETGASVYVHQRPQ